MLDNMVNCIFHRNQCSITNTEWDHDLTSTKYICAKHYLCLTFVSCFLLTTAKMFMLQLKISSFITATFHVCVVS